MWCRRRNRARGRGWTLLLLGVVTLWGGGAALAAPVVDPARFEGTGWAPFARAAAAIRARPGGRVSAVCWSTATVSARELQQLADAGFTEIILDGHAVGEGTVSEAAVADCALAAAQAGLISVKFVRGAPDWATSHQDDALRKVTALAGRLLTIRARLVARGHPEAAALVRGILVNVEPYADPAWQFDWSRYVQLHDALQARLAAQGLSYETFDAFWIGDPVHESGHPMTGYRVTPARTSYLMTYRTEGSLAFAIAEPLATRIPHVAGFDLVEGPPVGFRGVPSALPLAVAEYVDRALQAPSRAGCLGIFVHASSVRQLLAAVDASARPAT